MIACYKGVCRTKSVLILEIKKDLYNGNGNCVQYEYVWTYLNHVQSSVDLSIFLDMSGMSLFHQPLCHTTYAEFSEHSLQLGGVLMAALTLWFRDARAVIWCQVSLRGWTLHMGIWLINETIIKQYKHHCVHCIGLRSSSTIVWLL